jgi:NAD(P)-dependent dehydrogenase (short-subunit alcohol dehydrogenase family)
MAETGALTILITGCSSGFGKLTAETLAKEGYRVFAGMREVTGKNAKPARDLLVWAERESVNIDVVEMDVTDEDSVERGVKTIIDAASTIDVVVNNAGIDAAGILEAFTVQQAQAIFDLNTFGPLRVNRAVLPHMRKDRAGLLIYISSTGGRVFLPFLGIYSASKFALEALAKAYNYELGSFGIETAIIEPGVYPTPVHEKTRVPGDGTRLSEYGDLAKLPEKMAADLSEALSSPAASNPQEIADTVKDLIAMAPGTRPLRTVVGIMGVEGVGALNQAADKFQKQFLESLGA